MPQKTCDRNVISVPRALRLVGIFAGIWAILVVLAATIAYLPEHPGFSFSTTYLSDIGDTAGWPQILMNSGTLIAAPIRYLVIVLLVLRLGALGAGRAFGVSALVMGAISSAGTVLLTAVPFSVGPAVHKLGIPLYFLGVVILQTLFGVSEWRLKEVPKILPVLCFVVVVVFFIFAGLVILYGRGMVGRDTPVIWEWLAFLSSVVWVFAQSLLLGRTDKGRSFSGG